jgi:hypothetical protein
MKYQGATFPEAVAYLTGARASTMAHKAATRPVVKPATERPPRRSGLPEAEAMALVEDAEARLWSAEGTDALAYLTGPRCLSAETIRRAHLGWTPGLDVPRSGGGTFRALGIVIPWFNGEHLALVKIRQPDRREPKYVQAFGDPARLVCYPGPDTIRRGRPLVIVEGEFDALVLGEALDGLASVVTLGSAGNRPDPRALNVMLASPRWSIATDSDVPGDNAADGWPARARRVRPPEPFKDWTEAKQGGVNLRRWWEDILAGNARPPLFTWDELAVLRDELGIDNPGRWPIGNLSPRRDPQFLETLAAALSDHVPDLADEGSVS